MVAASVAQRKIEIPLVKGDDVNETYISFKDLLREDKRCKEKSWTSDSSDAKNIGQARVCGEEILPFNEVNAQKHYNVHTNKAFDGSWGKNKQNGEALATEIATQKRVHFQVSTAPEYTIKTKQKRKNFMYRRTRRHVRENTGPSIQFLRAFDSKHKLRKPYLVYTDESRQYVSNSKVNPSTHSTADDDGAHPVSMIVEGAYNWVAEEVLLSWFFLQCLGESVMEVRNAILLTSKQMEHEARAGQASGKVFDGEIVREKKAQCEVEQSQAEKSKDESAKEEGFVHFNS